MIVTCDAPWLSADFGGEREVIGWAPYRGGLARAGRILWRGVRNADLPPDLDAADWLSAELRAKGAAEAVCFLTSRDVRAHHHSHHKAGRIEAEALVTAGLSNMPRRSARGRAPARPSARSTSRSRSMRR